MAYNLSNANDRRRQRRHIGRTASQLRGVASVRKLLRQLPPAVKEEMADALRDIGPEYLQAVKADAPVRTGALRNALSFSVLKASLRLRVGLIGKKLNSKFFYGRIIELGRKAQAVTIRRGPRTGAKMRVRAMAPRRFVYKKRPELRARLGNRLNSFWEHALATAGQGAGND